MKKISAFIIAIIVFCIIVIVYNVSLNYAIGENINELYYILDDRKFNSLEAAEVCLNNKKSDNVLVLGSSELSSFNKAIVNYGNSNFNMYLLGRGYTQCLQSTLALGAIENKVEMEKVVLILSPQWFEGSQEMSSEIFASRFQKNTFNNFIKNSKISYETKQKVIEELKKLEVSDEMELDKINKYENAYLNYNIIDRIYLSISDSISNTKQKIKLIDYLNEIKKNDIIVSETSVKFEDYNFEELLEKAEEQGIQACTNNIFEIDDNYYNTYVKENEDNRKNSQANLNFNKEKEYEYLEMFLETCNQLGIEPLIVNVPVNGRWYDYIGVSKEKRDSYYNKIRSIVEKYDAKIADFSDCEYEKYFLRDIMHLGWKGWVKVDEEIYKYYYE